MASNLLLANGTVEVTVAASDKIAVYTRGSANVYQVVGYPNYPEQNSLLQNVDNELYTSSAFSAAATLVIEAGCYDVLYAVGTAPTIVERQGYVYQGDPTAMTTAASITSAGLLGGIVTGTHSAGATQAYTLPTGALLDAAGEFAVGDAVDWVLINLSAAAADTLTLTAATGHTIVGEPVVAASHSTTGELYGTSAMWRTRKTAADTFVTYRIA